jgi:hypothetical protein
MARYRHESAPIGDDVRESLLDDLRLSDRDARSTTGESNARRDR